MAERVCRWYWLFLKTPKNHRLFYLSRRHFDHPRITAGLCWMRLKKQWGSRF